MPMTARRIVRLCDAWVVRTRSPLLGLGVGVSCTILAACAARSSGGGPGTMAPGTYSAESGGATMSAQPGDCGMYPSFNIDANNVAPAATQAGIGAQPTPVDALRAVLTHGSMPYFGGSGGSGVVGMGFPAAGWTEVSATSDSASFRAPLHSGTAHLTFTRIGSRWLLSHGEKDC